MTRNFGLNMRERLIPWGHSGNQPPAYGQRNTVADSLPRFPSQSILHSEHVANSPLHVGAISFFALFILGVIGLFIASFYATLYVVGVVT